MYVVDASFLYKKLEVALMNQMARSQVPLKCRYTFKLLRTTLCYDHQNLYVKSLYRVLLENLNESFIFHENEAVLVLKMSTFSKIVVSLFIYVY